MQYKDYYKIMGVSESASTDEIKKAYRKLARRYHPDVSKEEDAEQKFKDLGEAYEVLKDKEKRQEYDHLLKMGAIGGDGQFKPPPGWESASHFSDNHSEQFSEFFEAMFGSTGGFHRQQSSGGNASYKMRGDDVQYQLPLSLEEAFRGGERVVELKVPNVDEYGLISHQIKKIKVKIPVGINEGKILRLKGQGGTGIGGGAPGDLLIKIKIMPHPLYVVEGKDISMHVPVTPWEAALGAKVDIPLPQGKIKISVPANCQAGKKLRLSKKGLPGSPPGDFFVIVKIVMPEQHTDKSKQLFEELAEEVPFNPRANWEK